MITLTPGVTLAELQQQLSGTQDFNNQVFIGNGTGAVLGKTTQQSPITAQNAIFDAPIFAADGSLILEGVESLANANLREADVFNSSFVGTNLSNADLTLIKAQQSDFTEANLSNAILDQGNLGAEQSERPLFIGTNLTDALFTRATIKAARFDRATLVRTNFAGTPLDGVIVKDVNAQEAKFAAGTFDLPNAPKTPITAATFTDSFFFNVNFNLANFENVILDDFNGALAEGVNLVTGDAVLDPVTGVNIGTVSLDPVSGLPTNFYLSFQGANLKNVSATGAKLAGTNFTSIDNIDNPATEIIEGKTILEGASFEFADLTGANFSGLNLTGVSFKGADLTEANFTNAILQDANLTEAILTDAIVTGADFSDGPDADLFGADLSKANVTGSDLTRAGLIADNATIVDTIGLL